MAMPILPNQPPLVQNREISSSEFHNLPLLEKIAKVAKAIFQTIALSIGTLLPFTRFQFAEFGASIKSIWVFLKTQPVAPTVADRVKQACSRQVQFQTQPQPLNLPQDQTLATVKAEFKVEALRQKLSINKEALQKADINVNPEAQDCCPKITEALNSLHLTEEQTVKALFTLTQAGSAEGAVAASQHVGNKGELFSQPTDRPSCNLDTNTATITRTVCQQIFVPTDDGQESVGYQRIRSTYDIRNDQMTHEVLFSTNQINS